jgi:hypothetical protein
MTLEFVQRRPHVGIDLGSGAGLARHRRSGYRERGKRQRERFATADDAHGVSPEIQWQV